MLKKTLLAASLFTLSMSASANWLVGGGYTKLSDDGLSLGALYGTVGYEFKQDQISIIPELRFGTGVKKDTYMGVEADLKSFYSLSTRVQYNLENNVYLYAMPTYSKIRVRGTGTAFVNFGGGNVRTFAIDETNSDSGWGYGAGIGYHFSETASIEASYEKVSLEDNADVLSLGFKYSF